MDIVFTFLIVLGTDAITKNVTLVLDQPESAGRESARWWARASPDHLLEQFRPSLVFIFVK